MTIRDLLTKHHLTMKALSLRFGIPLRTVENWSAGVSTPPDYLIKMIDELVIHTRKGDTDMTYKDNTTFIGSSDIASLTVRMPCAAHTLDFGEDGAYNAYICEGDVEIPPHYTAVFEGGHWFAIYDDDGITLKQYSHDGYTRFTFYRSGAFGCIIHWHN